MEGEGKGKGKKEGRVGGREGRGKGGKCLLGLLRLALWPPATFPEFADMVSFGVVLLLLLSEVRLVERWDGNGEIVMNWLSFLFFVRRCALYTYLPTYLPYRRKNIPSHLSIHDDASRTQTDAHPCTRSLAPLRSRPRESNSGPLYFPNNVNDRSDVSFFLTDIHARTHARPSARQRHKPSLRASIRCPRRLNPTHHAILVSEVPGVASQTIRSSDIHPHTGAPTKQEAQTSKDKRLDLICDMQTSRYSEAKANARTPWGGTLTSNEKTPQAPSGEAGRQMDRWCVCGPGCT